MKRLTAIFILVTSCALAQSPLPPLAEIKIAADAGDPVAQDKLAQAFVMHLNSKEAEIWYRKAAVQGNAHAQGQFGNMLLMRSRMSIGIKPEALAELSSEAVKWIFLAANQGDKQGQTDCANICFEGKLVKQDLVEAYKWGELVSGILGNSIRDSAILKMNADQIAEARKRVAAFVPGQPKKSKSPR